MRKFKIRKVKPTKLFTLSTDQDRVQLLTKISEDLKRYSPEDMPEVTTIKSWVSKELNRSLAKAKVHSLFSPGS